MYTNIVNKTLNTQQINYTYEEFNVEIKSLDKNTLCHSV